jgi:hypothetical protein
VTAEVVCLCSSEREGERVSESAYVRGQDSVLVCEVIKNSINTSEKRIPPYQMVSSAHSGVRYRKVSVIGDEMNTSEKRID